MSDTYIDTLLKKARTAQATFEAFDQKRVDAAVRAIGKAVYNQAEIIADMAVKETGYGRIDSKIIKLKRCTTGAWHYLHDKKSVGLIDYDPMEKMATFAKPLGIVAVLVPTTNPVSTTVSNGMSILKCRNAMIVSPHPRAKKVTIYGVALMRDALKSVGAPEDLIQIIETPSMDTTTELMKKVDVVVATGGAAMVKSAYSSGRPSFGVGPGNVQVIVAPDYADFDKLATQVTTSRSYDNGMPCTGEQALHLPREQMEKVLSAFQAHKAYLLPQEKVPQLSKLLFRENGSVNPDHVGMLPCALAELLGLQIPEDTSILMFECPGMTRENLLRREKLCPVIQYFPYDSFEEGVANAKSNLDWEGKGHTSVIYTQDTALAEYAAEHLDVSRLVVNQPAGAASGGNFINGLRPTMSLGCGSWGNNSISDNLSYVHLMNTTKLAYYHAPTIPDEQTVWSE